MDYNTWGKKRNSCIHSDGQERNGGKEGRAGWKLFQTDHRPGYECRINLKLENTICNRF